MKKAVGVFLILIIILSVVGCAKTDSIGDSVPDVPQTESSESAESEPEPVDLAQGKTIACCMGSINHPVHRVVQYGFCTKAEELGMNPIISGLEKGGTRELIAKWESDIVQNEISGVMLWTGDDSYYDMLKELKQKGIYTVVPYFWHSYEYANSFIDVNPYDWLTEAGYALADRLAEELSAKNISQGTVVIAFNGPGAYEGPVVDYGFRERMAEMCPGINIPNTVMMGAEINEAIKKGNAALEYYTDIVAVIGVEPLQTEAWVQCVENNGSDIIIMGLGSLAQHFNFVMEDKVQGLVCCPHFDAGVQSAECLHNLINGELYSNSENNWSTTLPVNIAYPGGEGKNNIQTYYDIFNAAQAYFEG